MSQNVDVAELAKAQVADAGLAGTRRESTAGKGSMAPYTRSESSIGETQHHITDEDLATLRRVSGKITWIAFTIAFVELCERFSYYGTTIVFTNFIQQPLPRGSTTGAGHEGQSGALDMGQRASTGLTTFNQFWSYVTPLFGAWIADGYLGRFNTILCAVST
jgi:POT family proton-dependent oligopeptide transporter